MRRTITGGPAPAILSPNAIALPALYIASTSLGLSAAGRSTGMILLLIACVLDYKRFLGILSRSPAAWLLLAFVTYITINQISPHEMSAGSWSDATSHLLKASLFIIFGYWLFINRDHAKFLAFSFAAGFLLRSVIRFPWSHIAHYIAINYRISVGFDPITLGAVSGMASVLLIFHIPFWITIRNRLAFYLCVGTSLAAGFWSVTILILSGSRSTWLAFFGAAVFSLAGIFRSYPLRLSRRVAVIFIVCAAALTSSLFYMNRSMLNHRIMPVAQTLESIAQHGMDRSFKTSTGQRVRLIAYAVHYWLEKPILGWGPSTSDRLANRIRPAIGAHISSFISTPLQLLVEQGLLGSSLALSVILVMLFDLNKARRRRALDSSMYNLILSVSIFEVIFSLFLIAYALMITYSLIVFIGGFAFYGSLMAREHQS